MTFSDDILRFDEKAIMRLRTLYRRFGYTRYTMSRFEQYGIYAENKSFLACEDILTFTDTDGTLMALRPDVTLSIVKGIKDGDTLSKLYYNENVYRPDSTNFRERMQAGLECIGKLDVHSVSEVIALAAESLKTLGENTCLDISHMGYLSGFLSSAGLYENQKSELLRLMSEKNVPELYKYCAVSGIDESFCEKAAKLSLLYGTFDETIGTLRDLSCCDETNAAISELEEIFAVLSSRSALDSIKLDFSIVNDLNYYSGVIFQGFIEGISEKVLSGGRYDRLLRKFGKNSGAVGFAVYLDLLEQLTHGAELSQSDKSDEMINIALPKGRLGEKAYAVFEASGYGCPEILEDNRKLVFENKDAGVRYFWVKPSDVPIYVERGVADLGVAGKDILLEYLPDVYELLDLGIGKCRMCVAAVKGFTSSYDHDSTLKVATKFPKIARNFYEKNGIEIDIIKLNGSIEIAPLLGLSDVIVDIVETGKTLLENNLEPFDTIVDISARLIANKASHRFQYGAISKLCHNIAENL